MRRLYLYLILATGLLFSSGCTKLSVSIEEQASAGLWFNQRREEVLYIDKEQSAFISQWVDWVSEENKEPTLVYRVGKSMAYPYSIENSRFIFKDRGYTLLFASSNEYYGYEEAWFNADGNLVVQMGRYFLSNEPGNVKFRKDTRPNSTWEVVYILKDSSFMVNSTDIR